MAATAPNAQKNFTLVGPFVLGLVLFAISYVSIRFTRQTGSIATLWPANALLLAVILRSANDFAARGLHLISALFVFYASNSVAGVDHVLSFALATANVAEVFTALMLLNGAGYSTLDISQASVANRASNSVAVLGKSRHKALRSCCVMVQLLVGSHVAQNSTGTMGIGMPL